MKVSVGTDVVGMADRFDASWGYAIADHPTFGSQIPAYITQSFKGELRVEALWTTDNVFHQNASPSGGDLPVKTITIEETDTTSPTPVKKTWTFTGRMERWEKSGQADQFVICRFVLHLNAEPTPA